MITASKSPEGGTASRRKTTKIVKPLRITVLAGGPGLEREVSLQSGKSVSDALSRLGHHVVLRDIHPHDLSALDLPSDFIFIALHGEFGEDGTVQTELERRGLHYAGSDATASRLAMNKVEAKRRFIEWGIPTPPFEHITSSTTIGLAHRIGFPAVVKPVSSGSSVDTYIVHDPRQLREATERLIETYREALVERYVAGRELTVGILGDEALPACEIRTAREFYDYQAKYIDDDTQYLFDIDMPKFLLSHVQSLSLEAHRCLDCRVFSRVDWMIEAETLKPYILEINTIPGFTSHSLLPKAAARVGLDFDHLCQKIVDLSLA